MRRDLHLARLATVGSVRVCPPSRCAQACDGRHAAIAAAARPRLVAIPLPFGRLFDEPLPILTRATPTRLRPHASRTDRCGECPHTCLLSARPCERVRLGVAAVGAPVTSLVFPSPPCVFSLSLGHPHATWRPPSPPS